MDTGAIIAIAVIAALILIALLVALPRMRRKAEERKVEQHRTQAAEHHRTEAEQRRHEAELAEADAKRARAEADINAKRAELHEQGLADHELGIEGTGTTRATETTGDGMREVSGGRAHDPIQETDGGRDTEFERGFEQGQRTEGGTTGRFTRTEQRETIAEPVRVMLAWPSISETNLTLRRHLNRAIEAKVWRSAWNESRSSPAASREGR